VDISTWLLGLGLEQYEQVFRDNAIDWQVLPNLTSDDLKEIVGPIGHRRRLLGAIRALHEAGSPYGSEPPPVAPAPQHTVEQAERRQLTVMFCDLVGSTELSGRLDPEDLRELIRRYQDAVSGVVVRHGGYVASFLGDGIVAYFGWPRANEDEAAQAVRAGLDSVAAVEIVAAPQNTKLQARVGIASGTVIVGDLEAAGRRQEGVVAGEAPNLAARLQGLAAPGGVVIGGLTRTLVGAAFVLEELGPQILKGIAEPVPAWRVVGERPAQSRFELREGLLTPMIGREQEIELLVGLFGRVVRGEGQLVLLSGEAGIGKSRLVAKLLDRLASFALPLTIIRMQCSSFHTTMLLHPVLRYLEHAAGFAPDDITHVKLDKLEALLRRGTDDVSESMALLAPLLSLTADERYGTIELPAEQRKERVLRILGEQFHGLAQRNPVVAIVEDAHWFDPAMREFIEHLVARLANMPVLLLVTHRPEFQSGWAHHLNVTTVTLNRFSREQSVAMIRVAGGAALPEDLAVRISQRADGVPLYIEELTRSVLDGGSVVSSGQIPETLHGSLMARLDRLGSEAKQLAQMAAVIGREFSTPLLAAATGKPADALDVPMQRLAAAQIVQASGSGPNDYAFRHALIQDAAYQSLLSSSRRQYHASIAEASEREFPEAAEAQPEVIAQHYSAAEIPERAIPFWLRAGERSRARSAVLEAIGHLQRGLALARALPAGRQRWRWMLDLLLALGDAKQVTLGQLAEALATYKEAAEMARTEGATEELARAAMGIAITEQWVEAPTRETAGLLEAALCGIGDKDTSHRSYVLSTLGWVLFRLGELERAAPLMAEASAIARRCGDKHALHFGLSRQILSSIGQPCPASLFPERRRMLDEERTISEGILSGTIGGPQVNLIHAYAPINAYLEIGDYEGFSASLRSSNDYLSRRRISALDYGQASTEAMRAILLGEFEEAERLADRALEIGGDMQGELAAGVYGVQMFTIRREQGRLAEVAPVLKRFIDAHPGEVSWRPGLALIASDLGFEEAARRTFAEMAAAGFDFPADSRRTLTLSYLAEVCTFLHDTVEAERLYDKLLPYRDNVILAPVATVCCGAAGRHLGMLAGVTGQWRAAEEHFCAAINLDERLHAWPWLAHSKYQFGSMLLTRGRAKDRERAATLLGEASATTERLAMPALQRKIRALEQ
jgi:class 3 adenylate cyclase/tetratricopeptide (TPR) repeat protein